MSETLVEVTLQRYVEEQAGTRGRMYLDGSKICETLEQPWRDNQSEISCIPEGRYKCVPHNTPHFPDVWEVTGVPGRGAILIHAGNTTADTHGCILVGSDVILEGVSRSQVALAHLRAILPGEFYLVVKNAQ